GLVDRFAQIKPTVLLTVDGYLYAGRAHDITATIAELQRTLPDLKKTVVVPYLSDAADVSALTQTVGWPEMLAESAELAPVALPFDAPLWILYSSGTTGL